MIQLINYKDFKVMSYAVIILPIHNYYLSFFFVVIPDIESIIDIPTLKLIVIRRIKVLKFHHNYYVIIDNY